MNSNRKSSRRHQRERSEPTLLRRMSAGEDSAPRNLVAMDEGETRLHINFPLLVATLVVASILGLAGYYAHTHMEERTASSLLERADALESQGQWSTAADYLRRYTKLRPLDAAAHIRLAEIYDRSADVVSRIEKAISLYYRAIGMASPDAQPALRARVVELNLQLADPIRVAAAEEEARALMLANPADPVGHKLLATVLLHRLHSKDFLDSGDVIGDELEKAFQLVPGDVAIALALAGAYRDGLLILTPAQLAMPLEARQRRADEIMDQLVESSPAKGLGYLARFGYREFYHLDGAEDDLAAALNHGPEDTRVLLAAARYSRRKATLGNWERGREYLEEAKERYEVLMSKANPPILPPYLELGEVYQELGNYDRATEVWRRGLEEFDAESVELHAYLASALVRIGRLEEAAQVLDNFEAVVKARSRRTFSTSASGHRAYAAGSATDQPRAPMEQAFALSLPDSLSDDDVLSYAWMLMGESYSALNQWPLAAAAYQNAQRLRSDSVEPSMSEAGVWMRAGDWQKAIRLYNTVLAFHNSPNVLVKLAQAQLRLQKELPSNERDWNVLQRTISRLESARFDQALYDPWRAELVKAEFSFESSKEQERPTPGDAQEPALAILHATEDRYPKSIELFRELVSIYEQVGASDDAARAADVFANLTSEAVQACITRSTIFALKGQYDYAKQILRRGLEGVSKQFSLPLELALIQINAMPHGVERKAHTRLVQLHDQHPQDVRLLTTLAESTLRKAESGDDPKQRLEELAKYENKLRTLEGRKGQLWKYYRARRLILLARTEAGGNHLRLANALQRELLSELPSWSGTHLLDGLILELRGKANAAVVAYERASNSGSRCLSASLHFILALHDLGRLTEAKEHILEIERHGIFDQGLSSVRISIAQKEGRFDDAISIARHEVQRRPEDAMALAQLAQAIAIKANVTADHDDTRLMLDNQAQSIVRQALAIPIEDPAQKGNLLLQVANVCATQHRQEDAIRLYDEVLQVAPHNVVALNNLATLLSESNSDERRRESRELIERAIAIAGSEPALLDTKAMSYYHEGNAASAVECLELAVAGPNSDPRHYLHLALAYAMANRPKESASAYQESLRLGLDNAILTETDQTLLNTLEIADLQ